LKFTRHTHIIDTSRSPRIPRNGTCQPSDSHLEGQTVQPFFAGLAPLFPSLYQVNIIVPTGITPGPKAPIVIVLQERPARRSPSGFSNRKRFWRRVTLASAAGYAAIGWHSTPESRRTLPLLFRLCARIWWNPYVYWSSAM